MTHISWSFLNKYQATVAAIKAFDSMNFIISHTDEEIQNVRSKMGSVASPQLSGLPGTHNPASREDRLLAGIDEIDALKERYQQAVEYMDWFKPAWEQLSEEDRFVLEIFLMSKTENPANLICAQLNVEKTSAYRKKERAVEKLSILLYGKI